MGPNILMPILMIHYEPSHSITQEDLSPQKRKTFLKWGYIHNT